MQVFVQTNTAIVDLSKVTHFVIEDIEAQTPVAVHFVGGGKHDLPRADAIALFEEMSRLSGRGQLFAHRAADGGNGSAPKPAIRAGGGGRVRQRVKTL